MALQFLARFSTQTRHGIVVKAFRNAFAFNVLELRNLFLLPLEVSFKFELSFQQRDSFSAECALARKSAQDALEAQLWASAQLGEAQGILEASASQRL